MFGLTRDSNFSLLVCVTDSLPSKFLTVNLPIVSGSLGEAFLRCCHDESG